MAILKRNAMRELTVEALRSKVTELENEVDAERIAKTTAGKPSNPGRARTLRKTIARIKTLLASKGIRDSKNVQPQTPGAKAPSKASNKAPAPKTNAGTKQRTNGVKH
jgi:ribosomal protein L29